MIRPDDVKNERRWQFPRAINPQERIEDRGTARQSEALSSIGISFRHANMQGPSPKQSLEQRFQKIIPVAAVLFPDDSISSR